MTKRTAIQVASNCSEASLQAFVKDFAQTLKGNERIFLEGELGVGKSTFARALITALGSTSLTHGSPSYPIIHSFDLAIGKLHHMDLYRVKNEGELHERGIEELLDHHHSVCVVEWASLFSAWKERVIKALVNQHRCFEIEISFDKNQEDRRSISLFQMN